MNGIISRYVLFVAMVVISVMRMEAQSYFVSFDYDDDGNRISRTVFLGSSRDDSASQNDTTEIVRYTEHIDESEISIYPNPTSESLFVSLTNMEDGKTFTATLLSPSGVAIIRQELKTVSAEFDLNGMADGIYILELQSGTETKVWKIIKR